MSTRRRFTFTLRAKTPIHFGGNLQGALLLDGDDKPFVSGNSIGGALRSWLNASSEVISADIMYYLGGPKKSIDEKEEFEESRVYISDGHLKLPDNPLVIDQGNAGLLAMEGTAVDPKTGSALNNHKYTRYDLPQGTELVFTVECDTNPEETTSPKEADITDAAHVRLSFTKLIYTWATAIHRGELRFGGQKSNGHGRFSLEHLTCREFLFDSSEALEQFIFNRHKGEEKDCTEDARKYAEYISGHPTIELSLKGHFPYGVYQSYTDREQSKEHGTQVTGLLRSVDETYYLPGSSIKGILRHEMRRLLFRMLPDQERSIAEREIRVDTLLQEWFGSQDKIGSVMVSNVVIDEVSEMNIERINNQNTKPTYNRIDRITGGVIDGALKTQNEVRGNAEIRLELRVGKDVEDVKYAEGKLFPLIYLLRNIGSGLLPLGGRTVIGLGQFEAKETEVYLNGDILRFSNTGPLDEKNQAELKDYYDLFVAFLNKEGEA
ncbi:RAMP superfamily CRISPR-associated protein [Paenibacillus sp. FSL R5-0473]|uniref:RAMP superfamily CRISPR-associated protein n=1 Tax=Paenibacillus sp. FSL R5-0473 TaxID=2921642 RepID=UPI0030FC816D